MYVYIYVYVCVRHEDDCFYHHSRKVDTVIATAFATLSFVLT